MKLKTNMWKGENKEIIPLNYIQKTTIPNIITTIIILVLDINTLVKTILTLITSIQVLASIIIHKSYNKHKKEEEAKKCQKK